MNDTNLPYPLPPSEPFSEPPPEKHSGLGIASFIVAILAMSTMCLDLVLIFSLSGGLTVSPSLQGVDAIFSCLSALLALVALGLGIAAVVQKNTKKVFGILGLVFSGLFLIGYCVIIGINLTSLAGSL